MRPIFIKFLDITLAFLQQNTVLIPDDSLFFRFLIFLKSVKST